jgi:hypothetical protein
MFRKCFAVGLIGMSASVLSSADVFAADTMDSRTVKLRSFFKAHQCPQPFHAEEYVRAADMYSIDYRLLPAVSVRESTCGVYQRLNNFWGWDSARTGFTSVTRGIHFILRQLAWGRFYRGKSVDQKLRVYNPRPEYAKEVRELMREIDSD